MFADIACQSELARGKLKRTAYYSKEVVWQVMHKIGPEAIVVLIWRCSKYSYICLLLYSGFLIKCGCGIQGI